MQRDLIVFGEDWGGLPSSTQHLVTHLAKHRRVLWVNSIGLRRPRMGWHDVKRLCQKLTAARQQSIQPSDSAMLAGVFSPMTIPAPKHHWERKLAARLISSQLKPELDRLGFNDPILWTSLPTAVDVAGQLGDRHLVYYCGDDFSALAGVDHATVRLREKQLLEQADLVMVASRSLVNKHLPHRTRLLEHGVSFERFSTPTPRAKDMPNDGRPIAGFYGSLSEWLDIELLEATIKQRPHWHFVFIGKPVVNMQKLAVLSNTHFLGERPHDVLPCYSQHWNASLLPFRNNAQIRACNPLKLREYLATGTTVISTPFPALNEYQSLVHSVTNAQEMAQALDACEHKQYDRRLVNAVAKHDWAIIAQQANEWLDAL